MNQFTYAGSELEIFADAVHWKAYVRRHVRSHLRGDVLEVGAGIGSTTLSLFDAAVTRWVCLEPDPELARRITRTGPLAQCEIVVGSLQHLPADQRFDTLLYIDVLEHIKEDAEEVRRAVGRLRRGGALVVLAPAHQWLYSPFDRAIGHFRRYSKSTLAELIPSNLRTEKLIYLDAAGMVASFANRFLQSKRPTVQQVRIWDRFLVPASRRLDPLMFSAVGKSVLGIWTLPA